MENDIGLLTEANMKDSPEKKTLNFSKKYVFEYSLTFMKTLIDLSTNIDSYSLTNVYKTVKNHILIPFLYECNAQKKFIENLFYKCDLRYGMTHK